MADSLPSSIPASLAAGDTWRWRVARAAYLASDGWALTTYLRGKGVLNVPGVPDDDAFVFTVAAAGEGSSAAVPPGSYTWVEKAAKDGDVFTVCSGLVTVTPNLATATAGQLQTHAEKALALVEAALEGRIVSDAESYTILGRSISKTPIAELRKLRAQYRAEVLRERGASPFTPVRYVLGRP